MHRKCTITSIFIIAVHFLCSIDESLATESRQTVPTSSGYTPHQIKLDWNCPTTISESEKVKWGLSDRAGIVLRSISTKSYEWTDWTQFKAKLTASPYDFTACVNETEKRIYRVLSGSTGDHPYTCKKLPKDVSDFDRFLCINNLSNLSTDRLKPGHGKGPIVSAMGELSQPLDTLVSTTLGDDGSNCWTVLNAENGHAERPSNLLVSREFIEEKLPQLEAAAPAHCKGVWIKAILNQLAINQVDYPADLNLEREINRIFSQFQKVIENTDPAEDSFSLSDLAPTCEATQKPDIRDLLLKANRILDATSCSTLAPGESTWVELPGGAPYSTTPAR